MTTKSRTAQAPIAIAMAMIAGRLEGHSSLLRSEVAQGCQDKLRLTNLATAVEDEAHHLRETAERTVDALGKKPVTLTFNVLAGRIDAPRVDQRTIAVRVIDHLDDVPVGSPAYQDEQARTFIYTKEAVYTSIEPREVLVARIEGHALPAENRALREALRALVNDATTANRYAARKLLGDA